MNENLCPYCNEKLIKGKIYGDRYQMKWMPSTINLALMTWVKKDHIKLGEKTVFKRNNVEADFCQKCEKIIINL